MAQLHRDGLSYMNPIKELIKEENNINSENPKRNLLIVGSFSHATSLREIV